MGVKQRLRICLSNRQLVMNPQGKVPSRAGPRKRFPEPVVNKMIQPTKRVLLDSVTAPVKINHAHKMNSLWGRGLTLWR